jgi:hypothetical protein
VELHFNSALAIPQAILDIGSEGGGDTKSPSAQEFLVSSHQSAQVFAPFSSTRGSHSPLESLVYMALPIRGWEILNVHQVYTLPVSTSPTPHSLSRKVAVLGLLQKMTGAAAVTSCEIDEGRISVSLKALGILGIWVNTGTTDDPPLPQVRLQGRELPTDGAMVRYSQDMHVAEGAVIEVDLLDAWNHGGFGVGQGEEGKGDEEVHVEICMSA